MSLIWQLLRTFPFTLVFVFSFALSEMMRSGVIQDAGPLRFASLPMDAAGWFVLGAAQVLVDTAGMPLSWFVALSYLAVPSAFLVGDYLVYRWRRNRQRSSRSIRIGPATEARDSTGGAS